MHVRGPVPVNSRAAAISTSISDIYVLPVNLDPHHLIRAGISNHIQAKSWYLITDPWSGRHWWAIILIEINVRDYSSMSKFKSIYVIQRGLGNALVVRNEPASVRSWHGYMVLYFVILLAILPANHWPNGGQTWSHWLYQVIHDSELTWEFFPHYWFLCGWPSMGGPIRRTWYIAYE